MTRRHFFSTAAAAAVRFSGQPPLIVPVHRVMDARVQCPPEQLHPEALQFAHRALSVLLRTCVIIFILKVSGFFISFSSYKCDFRIEPGRRLSLRPLVKGRALAGVSTIHEGYHVCLVALRYARGNQIPFLSVNTCVHELLHVLLQDVFVRDPKWFQTGGREFRIDWYATGLWLFHDGAAIRKSAQAYLGRLRSAIAAPAWGRNSA